MNKWTKVDPAMCQATIMACVFRMVPQALELKLNVTYEALAAMSPGLGVAEQVEADRVQDDQESWKGALKRFGKKCLMFLGDPDTQLYLLVWTVIGSPLMVLHYKLFKHVNFASNCVDDDNSISVFNFCSDCPQSNPAKEAMQELSLMMFDPNGAGSAHVALLKAAFGATVHWSQKLMDTYQKACILCYSKCYRSFIHRFDCFPWKAASIFEPSVSPATKLTASINFWNAPRCQIDPWTGDPLRDVLCRTREDLFDTDLQDFVYNFFLRCMVTSTFGERIFSNLTQWTTEPKARPSLATVSSKHVINTFDTIVQQWWRSLLDDSQIQRASGKCRDLVAYTEPLKSRTCGWHLYSQGSACFADVNEKQNTWTGLTDEQKTEWEERARKCRAEARGRGAPVDEVLASEAAAETPGGPWAMSCKHGAGPGAWPLGRHVIAASVSDCGNIAAAAESWRASHVVIWQEDELFPETSDLREACHPSECVCTYTLQQRERLEALSYETRLLLRHHGLPPHRPICLEYRCDSFGHDHTIFCLIGDHHWTHTLHAELMMLRKLPGERSYLFEMALEKVEADGVQWPVVMSEKQFLKKLVDLTSDVWRAYTLKTESDQVWSFNVVERTAVDIEELKELEASRLEGLFAMRLLKKITEKDAGKKPKVGRGRGRGRGRGGRRGRGRGRGSDDASESDSASPEPPDSPPAEPVDEPPEPPPMPPPADPPPDPPPAVPPPPLLDAGHGRQRVGERWGSLGWELASVPSRNGYGATCKLHTDLDNPGKVCKKSVTIGASGLSINECRLRLKRWLVAGLDDSEWPPESDDSQASHHISMGGRYLRDFAVGLTEVECDRIAENL